MINYQQLLTKLIQQGLSIPSNIAFYLTNLPFIERLYLYPRYQRFLEDSAHDSRRVSAFEQNIVQQLELNGIAITDLQSLKISHTESFLNSAQVITEELRTQSQLSCNLGKDTLTATAQQILDQSSILSWGYSGTLLRIAREYLSLPVAYDGLSFYYSVANGRERGPRKWHRDKEDWKMLKVCVYLHDVDLDGGPLECVLPAINQQICQNSRSYQVLSSEKLRKIIGNHGDDWYTSCTGKSGTVIFIDTARYYHRGRPPTKSDRSAIFFSYYSIRPKHPYYCGRSPLSQQQLIQFSERLPQPIKDSMLWRANLKDIGRYVPKNRLKV